MFCLFSIMDSVFQATEDIYILGGRGVEIQASLKDWGKCKQWLRYFRTVSRM